MATETKLPVTKTSAAPATGEAWQPFQALRNEIDQIFDEQRLLEAAVPLAGPARA